MKTAMNWKSGNLGLNLLSSQAWGKSLNLSESHLSDLRVLSEDPLLFFLLFKKKSYWTYNIRELRQDSLGKLLTLLPKLPGQLEEDSFKKIYSLVQHLSAKPLTPYHGSSSTSLWREPQASGSDWRQCTGFLQPLSEILGLQCLNTNLHRC